MDTSNHGRDDNSDGAVGFDIKFSHIQLYADHIATLSEYKQLETNLNKFGDTFHTDANSSSAKSAKYIANGQRLWSTLTRGTAASDDEEKVAAFVPSGRGVVKVRECNI